eukprot:4758142-Pleurochrysis_carterae.AAC.1
MLFLSGLGAKGANGAVCSTDETSGAVLSAAPSGTSARSVQPLDDACAEGRYRRKGRMGRRGTVCAE